MDRILRACQKQYPYTWPLIEIQYVCGDTFTVSALDNFAFVDLHEHSDALKIDFEKMCTFEKYFQRAYERAPLNQTHDKFPNIAKRFKLRKRFMRGRTFTRSCEYMLFGNSHVVIGYDLPYRTYCNKLEEFIAGIENQRAAAKNQIARLPLPIAEEILDNF